METGLDVFHAACFRCVGRVDAVIEEAMNLAVWFILTGWIGYDPLEKGCVAAYISEGTKGIGVGVAAGSPSGGVSAEAVRVRTRVP